MKTALLNVCLCLGLSLSAHGQSPPPVSPTEPVAVVAGQPIFETDLEAAMGSQQLMRLRRQEYEAKSRALESLIRLKLIEAEAQKQGLSAEELLQREADSKVADPTDGEVEAFYLGQSRPAARLEDAKEQYRAALRNLRIQRARQECADSLRAGAHIAIYLRPPGVRVAYDPARVRGNVNAPVTIIEFSDFQCPFCREVQTTLNNVLIKYKGRVKLAYMDFPLREIHTQASIAAEAARCAGEQGKFWEFHDALFADQSQLKEADLTARARALKLDVNSFRSCLDGGKYKPQVEADLQEGAQAGVAGTPAFFITGLFLSGAQPQAEFEKIIDSQLALLDGRNAAR